MTAITAIAAGLQNAITCLQWEVGGTAVAGVQNAISCLQREVDALRQEMVNGSHFKGNEGLEISFIEDDVEESEDAEESEDDQESEDDEEILLSFVCNPAYEEQQDEEEEEEEEDNSITSMDSSTDTSDDSSLEVLEATLVSPATYDRWLERDGCLAKVASLTDEVQRWMDGLGGQTEQAALHRADQLKVEVGGFLAAVERLPAAHGPVHGPVHGPDQGPPRACSGVATVSVAAVTVAAVTVATVAAAEVAVATQPSRAQKLAAWKNKRQRIPKLQHIWR